MMKKIGLILALLPLTVAAEDWKGNGELGFTSTSGNTDSQTLTTKLNFTKKQDKWAHTLDLSLLKASTNNVDSADSLILAEKSDYKIAEKAYVFASFRYEDDKFSGFDNQTSLSAGMGSNIIDDKKQSLDLSAGLGLKRLEVSGGESDSGGILSLQGKYKNQLSEHASFHQDLLFEIGDANTHSESVSALKMKIAGNLSSVLTYTVKNNSDVPAGVEKTDAITSIALGYDF